MVDLVLSSKLLLCDYGGLQLHEHWCPGCERIHQIAVNQPFRNGAQWQYDGNHTSPTFNPSINVNPNHASVRCHYFIRNGRIDFCSDSHHSLAGQSVELPDIPTEFLRDYLDD